MSGARHYGERRANSTAGYVGDRPACAVCGRIMAMAGKTKDGIQRWKCEVPGTARRICSRFQEEKPSNRAKIVLAHGGNLEEVAKELSSTAAENILEKYSMTYTALGQLERRLGAWCLRPCVRCGFLKRHTDMRRTKAGSLGQICLLCNPKKKASTVHARRIEDEMSVYGVRHVRLPMSGVQGINGVLRSRRLDHGI